MSHEFSGSDRRQGAGVGETPLQAVQTGRFESSKIKSKSLRGCKGHAQPVFNQAFPSKYFFGLYRKVDKSVRNSDAPRSGWNQRLAPGIGFLRHDKELQLFRMPDNRKR